MKSFAELAKEKKLVPAAEKDRATERGELLKKFCLRLNPSREERGLRPLSIARMGKIFEDRPISYLYKTLQECTEAREFGGLFWHIYKRDKPKKV